MSYKTSRVAYNSSWTPSGVGYYTRTEFVPPPTPSYQPQKVSYGTTSSSGGGGGGGGGSSSSQDCSCEGCLVTIMGILCTASIVLMVLIPNYPKSIPIGYVAIPATVFGIIFLFVLWYIFQRNCSCCC